MRGAQGFFRIPRFVEVKPHCESTKKKCFVFLLKQKGIKRLNMHEHTLLYRFHTNLQSLLKDDVEMLDDRNSKLTMLWGNPAGDDVLLDNLFFLRLYVEFSLASLRYLLDFIMFPGLCLLFALHFLTYVRAFSATLLKFI